MTKFNVHIYRELRLAFEGIEADSHEAAAAIARDKPTGDADDIGECDGDTFYACVDVQGDEDYEQSRWIDFEPERERLAAPKLRAALVAILDHFGDAANDEELRLFGQARDAIAAADAADIRAEPSAPALRAALEAILPCAENEAYALEKHRDSPEAEAEAERAWAAINAAHALLAEASAAGIQPAVVRPARFRFTHEPEDDPDRSYVLVDGRIDVKIVRTSEGVVIDVYSGDGIDVVGTLAVWDEDLTAPEPDDQEEA